MSTRPDSEGKKKSGPAWLGKRQAGGRTKQDPDWKKARVVQTDANAGYKVKRTLLWIACLALFAVFCYYLIPPRNTPLVLFHARAYPISLPPLALAAEDTVFLTKVSPSNLKLRQEVRFNRKEADRNSDEDSPQQLLARLKLVKPSGPGWFSRSGNVVIYVAAHGLVNNAGKACLVPPTSSPFEPQEWVQLEDFLRDICALPNLKRARKIVILDCNRIGTRWRSGVLDNRFADRLAAAAEAVGDDSLYILNSTSPGQVGWGAPELRGSVFGHFVGLGLRGDASVEFGRDKNSGVVSLLELHEYLCNHVDGYVQQRRGVRQTPLLIGPKGQPVKQDIPVVAADFWQGWRSMDQLKSSYDVLAKAKELIDPADQRPSPLQRAWEAYQRRADGLVNSGSDSLPAAWRYGYVLDPIRFAALEQRMLALEERFVAGQEYQEELRKKWETLAEELDDKNWRPFPANQAVTNLRLEGWQRSSSEAVGDPTAARATEFQAGYEAWLAAKTPEEKNAARFAPNEQTPAIQALLYRYGVDGSGRNTAPNTLDRAELKRACEYLQVTAVPGQSTLLPIEGQFLRLLNGNVSEPAQGQLDQALLARSFAERAATPNDVRTHYVIESLVNAADEERRQGEDAFFLGDALSVDGTGADANAEQVIARSAAQRFRRAIGSAGGQGAEETGYRGAEALATELEGMLQLRDRVWARLPHLAEWLFRRARLEIEQSAASADSVANLERAGNLLSAAMQGNVELAEQLEQVIKSRGQDVQMRVSLAELRKAHDELHSNWRAIEKLAGDDAAIIIDAESRFETPSAVRRIELLMQTPLVVDSRATQLLTKYRSTLDFWARPENAIARTTNSPGAKNAASDSDPEALAAMDKVFLPVYKKFWIDYHKLLTHGFSELYKNHLELLEVRDSYRLDEELRLVSKPEPIWQELQNFLARYDRMISERKIGLAEDAKDLSARDDLSRWDRQARARAFWLWCVDASTVSSKTNSGTFPADRLRRVDHWHLSCWHAWRLLHDFWGNGVLNDQGPAYFEQLTKHCSQAVNGSDLPFRYEVPGQQIESLSRLLTKRIAAQQGGLSLNVPDVKLADPKSPTPWPFEVRIQQEQVTVGQESARFPLGRAGFYLAWPQSLEALTPDMARWGDPRTPHRAPVVIRDAERERPPAVVIPADVMPNKFDKLPTYLQGRVWYRGHVWSDQQELLYNIPGRGYRLEYEAKKYSAPTIQVSGNDAPSGAVMFVLDCSRSMRADPKAPAGAAAPFDLAKAQLEAILADLAPAASPELKIGLMAYAHRTPTAQPDGPFYLRTVSHDGPLGPKPGGGTWLPADWLAPAGLAAKGAMADALFRAQFPHPDRDVEELVAPTPDWITPIGERLDKLTVENCAGETPLYYAIAQAILNVQKVKGVDSRQVIVITDGVNFPFGGTILGKNSKKIEFTGLAKQQNAIDYGLLTEALGKAAGVKVRVVLFGELDTELEQTQLEILEGAGKKPQYVVDKIPIPGLIAEKIKATFEKTTYSVAPPPTIPSSDDWLPFDKAWIYPQWPAPRDLLPLPSKQTVEVHGPRVGDKKLALDLELTGGEAMRLEYKTSPLKLLFQSESLSPFKTTNLEATGNAEPYPTTVLAEVLKPELAPKFEESQENIAMMFRVRLRSENNDTFIRRPRYVWAEIQPNSTDPKYAKLMFQFSDLQFMEKTSTPVMEFIVPQWPKAVRTAKINLWVRYTAPKSALDQPVGIEPGETNFLPIEGKDDLEGVTLRIAQQRKDGVKRVVTVTEIHPPGTQLANLYKTRVVLNPPATSIERMYRPADSSDQPNGEVVHTFTYDQEYLNDRLMLEVNSALQIKESSLQLKDAAPLLLNSWSP